MISRSYRRSDAASSRHVSAMIASELATKTIAYQSARRKPSVCWRRSRQRENIPHPAYRLDHLAIETLVHLLTHAVNQHVHHVRAGIEAVVPDVRDDHRLRHDPSRVAHQVFEQREF